MAEPKKRDRTIDRSYDDKNGVATITDNKSGETLREVKIADAHADVLAKIALRGLANIVVNTYTAALKAEGGTPDSADDAVDELMEAIKENTYVFRRGAGEGGLTVEEEKEVIANTVVALNFAPDVATAMKQIEEYYAVTKERTQKVKGKNGKPDTERKVISRPEYNKLKRIPQVREALDKADKESGVETLKGMFAPKAAAPEGEAANA